ncbi:AtpZ/AtpI family protein [Aquabacter sp. P-9]|uniref:AtpZ/AtpI family protein n=1 Tax=Aquabacter sediminis TaxID=3029197 RepID=UPI00237EDD84|nr:AtpZ/AtpI family protein [Aquabacter sp. P-9]MDE1569197.1 AtpZ/AtpI family protein [Aquabacter sp. P-9]
MALAFRLGSEFVAGTLVGAMIGWGIDAVFSVSPWGIILFTLIGFAAGVLNMMRAAGETGGKKPPQG